MAISSRRRESDIMKLMMSDYNVEMEDDGSSFIVDFVGPDDTYYEGGLWKVQVTLPKDYPYRSPSIGFKNRLYHPNVDELSGSVCLDVINQTWSPMYDLLNIFDMFLPQLLSYPNASDPLNSEAAGLMLHDLDKYQAKVRDFVKRFAAPPDPAALALAKKRRHLSTDSSVSGSTVCSSATSVTFSSSSSSSSTSEAAAPASDLGGGSASLQADGSGKHTMQNAGDGQDDDLSSLSGGSDGEGDDDLVLDL